MDSELIEQMLLSLKESIEDTGGSLRIEDEIGINSPIDKERFFPIQDNGCDKKVCFIDGGNLEILRAPSFSIQMIRIYYTIYQNNKRVKSKRREFFVLLKCKMEEEKLHYEVESFGDSVIGRLSFFAYATELRNGMSRAEISQFGGLVRRLCEIRIIEECIGELSSGDFIVLDGDLQEKTRIEHDFFNKIKYVSNDKGITVCGLAKTSNLLSDTGNSFVSVISKEAPTGEWFYHPLITQRALEKETVFTKLHSKASYVFKFEIRKENSDKINEILWLLKRNSVDPVFLGYPYGLIEADRFARVTNEELDYLKTKFMGKAGKWYKELVPYLNALNSHEILDNIR